MLPECIAHAEFQIRAVHRAHLDLEEHAVAMSRADQDVESSFGLGAAVEIEPVDGRTGPRKEIPRPAFGECVREIEVEGDEREVVERRLSTS
jgi:hypothetical protein